MLVISMVILLRNQLDVILVDYLSDTPSKLVLLAFTLTASFPIGYVVFAFFELPWLRLLKGTGHYVEHEKLRDKILKSIDEEICNSIQDRKNERLAKLTNYRSAINAMSGRAFFMMAWFCIAPDKLREHCQRRWEEYYISWGINSALVLSLVLSSSIACICSVAREYAKANLLPFALHVLVISLLAANGRRRISEVADIENSWILLFDDHAENVADILGRLSVKA